MKREFYICSQDLSSPLYIRMKNSSDRAKHAMQMLWQTLPRLNHEGNRNRVQLLSSHGQTLSKINDHVLRDFDRCRDSSKNDDRILRGCVMFESDQQEISNAASEKCQIILATDDEELRGKARNSGVEAMKFHEALRYISANWK